MEIVELNSVVFPIGKQIVKDDGLFLVVNLVLEPIELVDHLNCELVFGVHEILFILTNLYHPTYKYNTYNLFLQIYY